MKTETLLHFRSVKALTNHAQARQQQRGVSELVIDLLMEFGVERVAGDDATSIWADKKVLKEIKGYVGKSAFARIEQQLKQIYLIVNVEKVITVAYSH